MAGGKNVLFAMAKDKNSFMEKYNVTCPGTTQVKPCDFKGDISECKRIRDNGLAPGSWYYYWKCPKCNSTVAELNHNSPLNHPLQELVK